MESLTQETLTVNVPILLQVVGYNSQVKSTCLCKLYINTRCWVYYHSCNEGCPPISQSLRISLLALVSPLLYAVVSSLSSRHLLYIIVVYHWHFPWIQPFYCSVHPSSIFVTAVSRVTAIHINMFLSILPHIYRASSKGYRIRGSWDIYTVTQLEHPKRAFDLQVGEL